MKVMAIAGAITRRGFGRALCGAGLSFCGRAASVARLSWGDESGAASTRERRYRADAQILLLSVPLLHRQGVGGGSVLWRDWSEAGATLRLLEFDGYSLPARAAGLNRLGFIREMSRVVEAKTVESIYFGLMTASPEESAEQASKALHSTAKEQTYTVIDGRIIPSGSEASVAHFAAPAALSALQRPELMERARKALAAEAKVAPGPAATSDGAQGFLAALADMLLRPECRQSSYVYSGRLYWLWVTRAVDAKATAYFRERQLVAKSGSVIRVGGRLRRQQGGKDIEFRLWVEQPAERPLPLRIEYQAKSYLRLVFEAEPTRL